MPSSYDVLLPLYVVQKRSHFEKKNCFSAPKGSDCRVSIHHEIQLRFFLNVLLRYIPSISRLLSDCASPSCPRMILTIPYLFAPERLVFFVPVRNHMFVLRGGCLLCWMRADAVPVNLEAGKRREGNGRAQSCSFLIEG
jgi:hypothetical protein